MNDTNKIFSQYILEILVHFTYLQSTICLPLMDQTIPINAFVIRNYHTEHEK